MLPENEGAVEIKAVDGNVSLSSLYKPIALGYAIGMGVIFIPMFLLMLPMFVFSPGVQDQSGHLVTGPGPILAMMAPMIVMIPIILAMQGLMIGGAILLGLAIYRTRRPIRIVTST
jgi:hypothetical protein